jgi:hypothetical protein
LQKKELVLKIFNLFVHCALKLYKKLKVMDYSKSLFSLFLFIMGYLVGFYAHTNKNSVLNTETMSIISSPKILGEEPIKEDFVSKVDDIRVKPTFSQDLNTILSKVLPKDSIHAYYINRYAKLALVEKDLYGFPASVKLAQFLVEGGYDEKNPNGSRLVMEGNNPFGIKYYGNNVPNRVDNWEDLAFSNDFVLAKDDCVDKCKFIKFKGIWHSFRYHSKFMVGTKDNPSHYVKYIKKGDWKDWLDAIDKGNYATSNNYKSLLYNTIIQYDLHLLDKHQNGSL